MKFRSSSIGPKRVAEEEIIEVEDLAAKQQKLDQSANKKVNQLSIGTFKKPQVNRNGPGQKSALANLVKRKTATTATSTTSGPCTSTTSENSTKDDAVTSTTTGEKPSASKPATSTTNALSLLSGYDNSTDSDDSE